MSKSKNRPDVDTLMAERARFEAWLDQLLAKASKVPPHVVERVRGDYEARLAKVVDELRSRADDLRAETESLEARLATLQQELGARKDARAEDELRAMVGEYDEAAWQVKSTEHDEGIQRAERDRDRSQADLTRVREMLSETTRPSRAMRAIDDAAIPEEPTPAESTGVSAPTAQDGKKPGGQSAPGAPQRTASPFDEIGFLRTVVGRATPFGGSDSPAPRPSVAQPAPMPGAPPEVQQPAAAASAKPAPAPAVAPAAPAPVAAAAPVPVAPPAPVAPPVPVAVAPPAPVAVAPPAPAAVAPPAAAPVAPPTPAPVAAPAPVPVAPPAPVPVAPPAPAPSAFAPMRGSIQPMPSFEEPMLDEPVAPNPDAEADARAADASRTLKCQECGWMNYPTEWYCEKCGGELAAF